METSEERLTRWSDSLCNNISVGGLVARCPIAHKWKAPYRILVVREALLWRMTDLGRQILLLTEKEHILGARILLRSAIETLAILIYMNQKIDAVISGELSFFEFGDMTMQLLMGSRNESTSFSSVNILTALEKADRKHSGLWELHKRLSETAHPNHDGVLYGYSKSDPENFETNFLNRWLDIFGQEQEPATALVFAIFEHEYNEECIRCLDALEVWLRQNDSRLEAEKNGI